MIISCSTESPSQDDIQPEIDEVVDVRIFHDGDIRFNGSMITESGLPDHIESLSASELTRARIIIDENAYSGLVNKTLRLLYKSRIINIHLKMLGTYAFQEYLENKVHIDVLSSGKILFNGYEIHPEDLELSLKNSELSSDTEFILSVSRKAEAGPVFDLQGILAANNHRKISYEDLSKYEH